jgi:Calcineurin-like phosphoesterase
LRNPVVPLALAMGALMVATLAGGSGTASAERRVDPFIVAAGDVACAPPGSTPPPARKLLACHEDATAAMFAAGGRLSGPNLRGIVALGDLQYTSGRLAEFTYASDACSILPPYGGGPCSFDASWGSAVGRAVAGAADVPIYPTPGNHEYAYGDEVCALQKPSSSGRPYNACGYNDYFGNDVAVPRPGNNGDGRGSYAVRFDAGARHPVLLVALNVGQCERDRSRCAAGSRMLAFLRTTLSSPELNPPAGCVIVAYHQATWDASDHGDIGYARPVWQALFDPAVHRTQRPDVVLNGHDHVYERYPALDAHGQATSSGGIPELVVGTGGRDVGQLPLAPPSTTASPPASVDATHFGLEKISWSPAHGRISASFYREGDPIPFDPVTYRCRGAAAPTP